MAAVFNEEKINQIIRQVEFYFSDSNLPRDKFLRAIVEQSEHGFVSLALICSFTRMRSHLCLGVMKPEEVPEETVLAVAEVLRKSSLLKVSEDGKKVGRSTELLKLEEVIEQVDSRTVAASPLPYDVKIEDVQAFFSGKGKVNSVRLPRLVSDKRAFCGTALIEFSDEDDAKKALHEKLVFAGANLELKPKVEFDAERTPKNEDDEKNCSNKDSSNGSYIKGLIVAFKLMPMEIMAPAKQNDAKVSKLNKSEEVTEHFDPEEERRENAEGIIAENFNHKEKSSEDVAVEQGKENVEGIDALKINREEKTAEDAGEEQGKANAEGINIKNIDHEGKTCEDVREEQGKENEEINKKSVDHEEKNSKDIQEDLEKEIADGINTKNIDHEEKSFENVEEEQGDEISVGVNAENIDHKDKSSEDLKNKKADSNFSHKIETEVDRYLPTTDGKKHGGSTGNAHTITREILKEVFQKFGIVKYIDYRMGEKSGYIRFDDPEAAVKARASAALAEEGGLVVKKIYIATLEALTGEAERDYWSLVRGSKTDKYKEQRGGYRGRGKKFHGKRPFIVDSGKERPNKAQKVSKQ